MNGVYHGVLSEGYTSEVVGGKTTHVGYVNEG